MWRCIKYPEANKFWHSNPEPKCTYDTFIARVIKEKNKWKSLDILIKKDYMHEYLNKDATNFYNNYKEEKCWRITFNKRVKRWFTFKDAIDPLKDFRSKDWNRPIKISEETEKEVCLLTPELIEEKNKFDLIADNSAKMKGLLPIIKSVRELHKWELDQIRFDILSNMKDINKKVLQSLYW